MEAFKIDGRSILCKCGYHKYDMKNMTMMYLGEAGGTVYKYNVQNNCVNCGHHFDEIVYIPMPIWTNKNVAVWGKDYEFVKEEGEKG